MLVLYTCTANGVGAREEENYIPGFDSFSLPIATSSGLGAQCQPVESTASLPCFIQHAGHSTEKLKKGSPYRSLCACDFLIDNPVEHRICEQIPCPL